MKDSEYGIKYAAIDLVSYNYTYKENLKRLQVTLNR